MRNLIYLHLWKLYHAYISRYLFAFQSILNFICVHNNNSIVGIYLDLLCEIYHLLENVTSCIFWKVYRWIFITRLLFFPLIVYLMHNEFFTNNYRCQLQSICWWNGIKYTHINRLKWLKIPLDCWCFVSWYQKPRIKRLWICRWLFVFKFKDMEVCKVRREIFFAVSLHSLWVRTRR